LAVDGRIVHGGIISLCQLAATFEIVKRFRPRLWLTQAALYRVQRKR